MIRSMTGFGRGEADFYGGRVKVELKSVNHRFFDLSARLPNHIAYLEDRIKAHIHKKIKRGRVSLVLLLEGRRRDAGHLTIDRAAARKYYNSLNALKKELGLSEPVRLSNLLSLPEVIVPRRAEHDLERLWPPLKKALDSALGRLAASRVREGSMLRKDLISRINSVEKISRKIKTRAPHIVSNYRRRLREKIRQMQAQAHIHKSRIEAEVAFFARNCDVAEEVTRIFSHISSFKETLSARQEAGRKLDFIAQEMFRETNTIGAKAQDARTGKWVVDLKELIEQIREQVQNVE